MGIPESGHGYKFENAMIIQRIQHNSLVCYKVVGVLEFMCGCYKNNYGFQLINCCNRTFIELDFAGKVF